MSVIDYFPAGYTPRESQEYILHKYEELKNSYDKIIISDPVGGGKSLSAYTIANYNSPSYIVTTTKGLQNQYKNSLELGDLRGKNNFKCPSLIEKFKEEHPTLIRTLHTLQDYKDKKLTADYLACSKMKNGNIISCMYKDDPSCSYQVHKKVAYSYPIIVTNYSLFFINQMIGQNKKIDTEKKYSVVFDEAHSLEDNIVDFASCTVTNKTMTDGGIFWNYTKCTIENVIEFLGEICDSYKNILKIMKDDEDAFPKLNEEKIKHKYSKLVMIKDDIIEKPENFVYYIEKDKYKKNQLNIKPLDLSGYIKKYLDIQKQTFLSGTIDKKFFCKSIGINPDDVGFIEVPKSMFSKEARKIEFRNTCSMSVSNQTEQSLKNMHDEINRILTHHEHQRGLIHTSSKEYCAGILRNLTVQNRDRVTMVHSDDNEDGKTVDEILEIHADTPGSVLVSSSLWTGYDFKDDLARFQIMHKLPLGYYGDPWIRAKKNRDSYWYYNKAIVKVLQGTGRIVRNENDWGITYCLDSEIKNSFNNNKSMIPESFHDVIFES